jgi:enoyl-CoA hydratase/carnithine racemase
MPEIKTRETVIEELEGGVLVVTMNRPEKKNAFNGTLWREFREALDDAKRNDAVRVVIVTGAGKAFTAGQDLAAMAQIDTSSTESENGFGKCMDTLCDFDKPLIAAVNGVGVGFGMTMLLYCDYIFIAKGTRLRAPFVTLGVVPEAASSYLLPVIIGHRNATDLLFESDFITAERAVELGLATKLCEPTDYLEKARERAHQLAAKPLGSMRKTKQLVLAARDDQVRAARRREDAAFIGRVGSPENIEAITAFFEKREPDFSNVPSNEKE